MGPGHGSRGGGGGIGDCKKLRRQMSQSDSFCNSVCEYSGVVELICDA